MSTISNRLVSIAASTLVLSLVSAAANAQTDVLKVAAGQGAFNNNNATLYSSYTFQDSMILNSIGFLSHTRDATMAYSINGGAFVPVSINDPVDSYNLKWITLNQSVTAGTVVTVRTGNASFALAGLNRETPTSPPATTVAYNGLYSYKADNSVEGHGDNITNSNLRVSNPGSNVAPEPGSFALALTGGAALLGICVRRRRNAG